MMKRLCIALVLAGSVAAHSAWAQQAVIDSANLTQNIKTAAQAVVEVEQLKAQLAQLQQTYAMLTNPTDIMDMAPGMESQALENPMPMANSLSTLIGGASAGGGAAQTYYDQNHVYSPTDATMASADLNKNAQSIANVEGMASTNLTAIEQRLQELPNLESDLNSATSITQVDAINGRITAESQFVQAQQAQAQNLQVLAAEQVQSQQQQDREQFNEDMTNAASDYQQAAVADGAQQ